MKPVLTIAVAFSLAIPTHAQETGGWLQFKWGMKLDDIRGEYRLAEHSARARGELGECRYSIEDYAIPGLALSPNLPFRVNFFFENHTELAAIELECLSKESNTNARRRLQLYLIHNYGPAVLEKPDAVYWMRPWTIIELRESRQGISIIFRKITDDLKARL